MGFEAVGCGQGSGEKTDDRQGMIHKERKGAYVKCYAGFHLCVSDRDRSGRNQRLPCLRIGTTLSPGNLDVRPNQVCGSRHIAPHAAQSAAVGRLVKGDELGRCPDLAVVALTTEQINGSEAKRCVDRRDLDVTG
jgi:hypothetical protein